MTSLFLVVGLALMMLGLFLPELSGPSKVVAVCFGTLTFVISSVASLWMGWYRKASANQAFVRTGLGGPKVVLDGGAMVWPLVHRCLDVNLQTMKLGVNPRGRNALITRDNLRADVLAQFYIKVQPDTEHVLTAARSLGEDSVNAQTVENLVSEKLVSALRAIASQMDLFEIHTKRDEFAEKVKEHVRADLDANGLLLESVTISELDQTDPAELSDNNVFDAQGKKKITEITAAATVERNKLERDAERQRTEKDVETRQQVLELERRKAEAEAGQAAEVAIVRAAKDREAKEAQIMQQQALAMAQVAQEQAVQAAQIGKDQAVQQAKVAQELAVKAAEIQKDRDLSISTVERDKAVKTAQVQQELAVKAAEIGKDRDLNISAAERDKAVKTAQVEQEKAVALADRIRQIAIAEQETARAKAEEAALLAEVERERALQQIATVQQLAEAERDAEKKLITAKKDIERSKIADQTQAEVSAYTKVKQAEAEQEAATRQASARLQLAQAEAESRKLVAAGEAAHQMVPVQVDRERVRIKEAEVAVEAQGLENRQKFAAAGIELEIQKLRISADKDVQIAMAEAFGKALAASRMTLYGSPETAGAMLTSLTKGMGARTMLEGFLSNSQNGEGGSAVGDLVKMLEPALQRFTNGHNSDKTPS
jgi:uncharacterized membrane protein YqiK